MLSDITDILTAISQINESIPGMFILHVFLMVIQNMVMKCWRFVQHVYIFDPSSSLACRVESILRTKIMFETNSLGAFTDLSDWLKEDMTVNFVC